MFKFDSETFIKEMESLESVEETPLDYEEFEMWLNNQYGEITERELKSDI